MIPKFDISVNYDVVDIGHHMREIEKTFGGVRPAARASDIDPGYWIMLRDGKKTNPSDKVLKSLGLQVKTVTIYLRRRVDTRVS